MTELQMMQVDGVDEPTTNRSQEKRNAHGAILFVDDDERFIDLCTRRFESTDYLIYTADCAENALAVLASESVDVIVSDMCMPGASGAELLNEVQQKYPDVIRIIISGRFDFTDTLEAINKGHVDHYITKPFNDKDLKLTIYSSLLEKRRRDAEQERERQKRKNVRYRASQLGKSVAKTKREVTEANRQAVALLTRVVGQYSSDVEVRADLAEKIAGRMGMSISGRYQVKIAALLQDASMIHGTESKKSDILSHPQQSSVLLEGLSHFEPCVEMIRNHHERFDGTGPNGLAGNSIPEGARIITAVNGYVRLRRKSLLSHTEAIDVMLSLDGRFDPRVVATLSDMPDLSI